MSRIVILGGGFAGTACAIHLMRDHPGLRAELTVIEPRERLGAGLAYSAPAREHRINVAAARMTASIAASSTSGVSPNHAANPGTA
jgi:uncharacterized NAD(P)/FAD-binding protein YdhS